MERIHGTVTYEGGEVVAWTARPRDIRNMENFARRHGIAIGESISPTLGMVLAWSALGVEQGFDVWVETLEDFDDLTGYGAAEEVDPFPEGASRA